MMYLFTTMHQKGEYFKFTSSMHLNYAETLLNFPHIILLKILY